MIDHLLQGYAALHEEGEIVWRSEHLKNTLMNQGEQNVLDVYLAEAAHKTKYLALLDMTTSLADPLETDTIATLASSESKTPGSGGYSRQQVLNTDWGATALVDENYKTTAGAAKVFGAMTGTDAFATHVLMVTTSTGTSSPTTLALAFIPLGTRITIAVGLTFSFTPSVGAF